MIGVEGIHGEGIENTTALPVITNMYSHSALKGIKILIEGGMVGHIGIDGSRPLVPVSKQDSYKGDWHRIARMQDPVKQHR